MKTVIAAVFLIATNALAWTDGTYQCNGTQTVSIRTVEAGGGITVPYMEVTEKLTQARGMATVVTNEHVGENVVLTTGQRGYAVKFKNDRVQEPCRAQ